MTYRAAWVLADGLTPAPGPDLGQVQPGQTATVTRRLKNIGDQSLSAVQFTLLDTLTGLNVTVNGVALDVGVMYAAPGLAPDESVPLILTRTVPPGSPPGVFAAFIRIQALT